MKLLRYVTLGLMVFLSAAWLQADEIGAFIISGDGWPGNESFGAVANTGTSFENFIPFCFGPGCECEIRDLDPTLKVNLGGGSIPVGTVFSFSADSNGFVDFHGLNVSGVPFTDLLITVPFDPNATYFCSTDAFAECGFKLEGDPNLLILFTGGPGIPAAIPEPGSWMLLLTVTGALLVRRTLRSRA